MANPPRNFGCTVALCDGDHHCKGLCRKHYERRRRLGTTALPSQGIPRATDHRTPGAKPRRGLVVVPDGGTITLADWKQRNAADIHVVRPMPRGSAGTGGWGDVA